MSSLNRKHIPLYLFALLLLAYSGYRAIHLSLTHDEGSTFLNHIRYGYFECFFKADCWAAANNHLLNTAGIKFFTGIFGNAEWVIRLPNWLSHVLYLTSSIVVATRLSKRVALQYFGFAIMNLLPMLVEFFGLARGYAMGTAWAMTSLMFIVLAANIKKPKFIWMAMAALLLSVFSNFTFALYFASLLSAFGLLLLFDRQSFAVELKKHAWLSMISVTVLAAITIYTPIKALSENGEFLWGTDTLLQAFDSLTVENTYGHRWYPMSTQVLTVLFLILIGSSILFAFYDRVKTKRKNSIHLLFALLFVILTIGVTLNHILFGAKFPVGRKMFIFIPPACLLIYQLIIRLGDWQKHVGTVFACIGSGILLYHFGRSVNFDQSRTWYYDVHTKDMMIRIENEITELNHKPSLGVFWIYSPASKYYVDSRVIQLERYDRLGEIKADTSFDYYYIERGQMEGLKEHYHILEDRGGHVLLRHHRWSKQKK